MASRIYLVGNYEISEMLGKISRQRVYQITRRADFPRPVAKLAQGKVWLGEQVEAWIATRRGKRADRPSPPDTAADRPSPPDTAERPSATTPGADIRTGQPPGPAIDTETDQRSGPGINGQARAGAGHAEPVAGQRDEEPAAE
ncbi:helix-turn-helix transcriptional regulator [Actinoplanes utahensis]|uniref:helix-turn-helix transcriptional regulator n=1 Tax=Actinoplanes utahensis TaxID=1869 RepID=UPI001A4680D3|nr:hypothetical protein [Actinoplanes utahensis]GIF31553.1 hypothetical protein Aut01nite_45390 [Actinoplanes utahensis]